METKKQEAIRLAYDKLDLCYNDLTPDENGWSTEALLHEDINFDDLDTKEMMHGIYFVRPKSLSGIEDNNGWISLKGIEKLNH